MQETNWWEKNNLSVALGFVSWEQSQIAPQDCLKVVAPQDCLKVVPEFFRAFKITSFSCKIPFWMQCLLYLKLLQAS